MKLNVDKAKVEVLLDDKDMHDLLSGKSVGIGELGANDSRPLVVSRWKNPTLKVTSKDTDLRGIALLTGENPYDKLARERPDLVAKTLPVPEQKPFSIRRVEDAAEESGQAREEQKAGAGPSAPFPRERASRFRSSGDSEGGHEEQGVSDGGQADGQEANHPQTGMAPKDTQGGV